jgi:glutamate-5-semialdehyde dehydrogenase
MSQPLERLAAGMPIPFGGDRLAVVSAELAAAFQPGDHLIVVQESGDLLRVPAAATAVAKAAVDRAWAAFAELAEVSDAAISDFFDHFGRLLADDGAWEKITAANTEDVARARAAGRSTTRLQVSEAMRADMIAGLEAWREAPSGRDRVIDRAEHPGWSVELAAGPLGVVGFVFEGRPNVFADATGVIRGGNCAVFRIGRDALATARAIAGHALTPALRAAGLPPGAAVLLESVDHAAGWALFSDPRLALAVARGSGAAVAQLGAIARQSGIAASLHGTGGAWLIADDSAETDRFGASVLHSLDRKACNTLNVCCLVAAPRLVAPFLAALKQAGDVRGHGCKLHLAEDLRRHLPAEWREARTLVRRADGDHDEPLVEDLAEGELAREWEWEETPEVSLVLVGALDEAIALYNAHSPQFIVSLISGEPGAHARLWAKADAGFVGDGFTRWVDGQYALDRPELGLSNWQTGRPFARGGILSGDGVFTVRARMRQSDPGLRR